MVFLILDDANALRSRTAFIKEAAQRLVKRLTPEDWVGMVWVNQSRGGAREFTRDRESVLQAIDQFSAQESQVERWFGHDDLTPGLTQSDSRQMKDDLGAPVGEEGSLAARANLSGIYDAERPLRMIRDVSNQLSAIQARRRVVVYIGQGALRTHFQLAPGRDKQVPDLLLPRAIAAAKDANVTFYAIDVSDPANRQSSGPRAKEGPRISELASISTSTGGTASTYSNPVEAADRVVSDSSRYYLVGYVAEPPKAKEAPRRIEVRTTRAGVGLFAQKAYIPIPHEPSLPPRAEAVRAVRDLIPKNDLGMRAFAVAFAERGQKKQAVALAVEVTVPEASVGAANFVDDIEMTLVAAAPVSGVRATETVTTHVALDETKARAFEGRYVICARIDLDPGQYQLRVGLRSAKVGRSGSVYLDLNVPNFAAQSVSLSDLALGQTVARASVPVGRRHVIAQIMPFVPSLTRDFNATDNAWAYARVYSGARGPEAAVVVVQATIEQHDSGEIAWTSRQTYLVDFGKRKESDYRVDLPLASLPPGSYRLRVEADPQSGNAMPAHRDLDFRIANK